MRKIILGVVALLVLGGGILAYSRLGGSPEVKRDRALKKARDYMAQAKIGEATIEYKNALSADPASPDAHYEFGMALLRQGDSRAGYRELGRATDLKPDFIRARFQVATYARVKKTQNEPRKSWKRFGSKTKRQRGPLPRGADRHGGKTARQRVERARSGAKQGTQAGIDLFGYGTRSYGEKDYPAAEEDFAKRWNRSQVFSRADSLAQLYVATGKQDQAEQELLLATKADPENEELLHILGNFYSSTRRYDDLEKLYQDLLKKKPDSVIAKKRLVEIYFAKNDRKQAKQYIDEILKSNANDNDGLLFSRAAQFSRKRYQKSG